MLVTIMPGPCQYFRVRELAPNTRRVNTVLWTGNYETAVDFVRDHYEENDVLAPCDFRAEVLARKRGHNAHNHV